MLHSSAAFICVFVVAYIFVYIYMCRFIFVFMYSSACVGVYVCVSVCFRNKINIYNNWFHVVERIKWDCSDYSVLNEYRTSAGT